jgi:uncharacterized protein
MITSNSLYEVVAELSAGLRGCYRCGHVWRPARRAEPQVCPHCKSRSWRVPILKAISRGRGAGISEVVGAHRADVLEAASRHGFHHVRVFGSVRRSQATARSDLDLLVDRAPGTSLLERASLISELESLLRRRVDVVPEESLHWLARPQILFEAVPL